MSGAPLTAEQQSSLVSRISDGDLRAEEDLVRIFWPRITFLVIARTGDREAAPDIAQEVMLTVVNALRSGQLREPDKLIGFVYGTARNFISNHLRARSRRPPHAPIDEASHVIAASRAAEDAERVDIVRRAISLLE